MATAQRVLYETITVIVFLALLAGTIFWAENRLARRAAALKAEQDAAIAAAGEEFERHQQNLAASYAEREQAQAIAEARAVFSAFESGIRSAVAARWSNYLTRAKSDLLAEPKVAFVHVLSQSGLVLASSDEKLTRTGRADERADWVLASTEVTVRDSSIPGHVELGGPLRDSGRTIGYLWLGYDTRSPARAPEQQ